MRRLWLLPLIALLVFLSAFALASPAQGEIDVISSRALVTFPLAVTFNLQAKGSTEIVDIDLKYRVDKLSLIPVTWRVDVDFTPGKTVNASWTWDMLETGGLPPGSELEYWWLIEDATGQKIETSSSTLEYDDFRYDWNSLASAQVTLYWYQGNQSFSQQLMGAAEDALQRLTSDTGISLEQPVDIYIYASSEDLRGALVYPQEWTGGVAFPDYRVIVIGISPDNLAWGERTVAHELSHLVVHQSIFGPFGVIPTWLDEGLAVYAEGELSADFRGRLDEAISRKQLISVRSLSSSFPTDPTEARLSYAESFSLVNFLIDNYGKEKMFELLGVFQTGADYDEALILVYGFDMDGLDARWRASLGLLLKPGKLDEVVGCAGYLRTALN